jgi:adenylate cyclase
MSARLSNRYSSPIQALIKQSERLRTLNTERIETLPSEIAEIAQLNEAQESMRLALDSFAKYVPSDVVRELLIKGEAAVIGGRSTPMSILFTDIEGFTSISEKMTPTDLTAHMADYFDAMIGIITENEGIVDKLIGDAIVALWSAPKVNECHARDSVRAALRCSQYLLKVNDHWEEHSLPRLPTRFGISTGEVVVGNVGSSNRLSYTVIGDAVNLAARLEGANKFYGTRIIASSATHTEAGDAFLWRKLDKVRVKGRSEPELIYELLGEKGDVADELLANAHAYEQAFDQYLERDFATARDALDKLADANPSDQSIARLAHLCHEATDNPPPPTWDGVSEFKQK